MPIHVTLDENEEDISCALPYVDRADVCSTCFTLARSPGMHLTALLTRILPCRNRRVLCVRDWSRRRRDEHDMTVLLSESYDELREIHWSSYHYCLPVLPDLLSLAPRLQRLTVEALDDPEAPIDDVVPECPPLPEEAYTFSLTSLECSAVLSAEVLSRVLACSTRTLRHMYLLIHASEFNKLATTVPELPVLRSLAILQADGLGDRALIARFLRLCPRLTALTVATEDPGASDGVHIWVPSSPQLRTLTVYATYRYWSARCTQVFRRALLEHWPRLRRLELVVNANGCSEEEEAALRRVCADARIALHVIRLARPRFPAGWRLPGVVPATYGDYPRV